jgi:hypothetical protein
MTPTFLPYPYAAENLNGEPDLALLENDAWVPVARFVWKLDAIDAARELRKIPPVAIQTRIYSHDGWSEIWAWAPRPPSSVAEGQIWQRPDTGNRVRVELLGQSATGHTIIVFRTPGSASWRVTPLDEFEKTFTQFYGTP